MNTVIFLSSEEKSLLIDGYTRKIKNDKQYIPIELCNIIIVYFSNRFNFFIVFEKNGIRGKTNELLCFNIENKQKLIIENECWKYVIGCSYCVEYDNENNKHNIDKVIMI